MWAWPAIGRVEKKLGYAFMILAAFVPVFLWLKYFHERVGDAMPAMHLCLAFLAGMMVAYPGLVIEKFLLSSPAVLLGWLRDASFVHFVSLDGRYAANFAEAYVLGGLVEETLKLLAILAVLLVARKTARPKSLIVIAVAVGGGICGG